MKRISCWRWRRASKMPFTPSPGNPKIVSTPQSIRRSTSRSATVFAMADRCAPSLGGRACSSPFGNGRDRSSDAKDVALSGKHLAPTLNQVSVRMSHRTDVPVEIAEAELIDVPVVFPEGRVPVHLILQAVPSEPDKRHPVLLQPMHVCPFFTQPADRIDAAETVGFCVHYRQSVAAEVLMRDWVIPEDFAGR